MTVAQRLVLIIDAASVLRVSKADWLDRLHKKGSREIVVAGKEHWHFGYNYTVWALKIPFYVNDVLGELILLTEGSMKCFNLHDLC